MSLLKLDKGLVMSLKRESVLHLMCKNARFVPQTLAVGSRKWHIILCIVFLIHPDAAFMSCSKEAEIGLYEILYFETISCG